MKKSLFKNKAYYIPESESIAAFKLIDENRKLKNISEELGLKSPCITKKRFI